MPDFKTGRNPDLSRAYAMPQVTTLPWDVTEQFAQWKWQLNQATSGLTSSYI